MKKTLSMLAASMLMVGCAHISVRTPSWSMSATTVFKDIQVPELDVGADGGIRVRGYRGNPDLAAIEAAIESAVGKAISAGFAALMAKI